MTIEVQALLILIGLALVAWALLGLDVALYGTGALAAVLWALGLAFYYLAADNRDSRALASFMVMLVAGPPTVVAAALGAVKFGSLLVRLFWR